MMQPLKFLPRRIYWLWVSVLVIVIDQITKHLALHYLTLGQAIKICPVFNLTLAFNRGAAFSFLANQSGWQLAVFVAIAGVVVIALLLLMLMSQSISRLTCCSFALLIGGALGNVIDRVGYGMVVDFIDLHWHQYHWPVFNVADSAITLGAILYIIAILFERKRHDSK